MAFLDNHNQSIGDGPERLRCPITLLMYRDPVVVESGNTYERSAIQVHWKRKGCPHDPLTNTLLRSTTMLPNWDKRREVQDFLVICRARCPDYVPEGWGGSIEVPGPKPLSQESLDVSSSSMCMRVILLCAASFFAALLAGSCSLLFGSGTANSTVMALAGGAGVDQIIAELKGHSSDSRVQAMALEALAFLASDNKENRAAISQAGGIVRIVEAMREHLQDPEVQGLACLALGNLASNSAENAAAVVRAGGIGCILSASREHPTVPSVQIAACWALWSFSSDNPINRAKITQAGGIEQIVIVMREHVKDSHVQAQACGALWSLSSDAWPREVMVRSGGIRCIIKATHVHPHDSQLQVQACGALWNLAANSLEHRTIIAGILNATVQSGAARRDPLPRGLIGAPWNSDFAHDKEELAPSQGPTCGDLWNATSNSTENRAATALVGGIARIISAMKHRPGDHAMGSWFALRRLES
mmetsp:Transcript_138175/g.240386  ORF Transcript_138175/g.240386 Transcript_138175/m.240386 type:complete len:474 (-) Transcript_138175:200-1621(-)